MTQDSVIKEIADLIPTLDGWCTPERACELAAIVIGLKPQTSVCIGVWGGRDTFALAMAHRFNGFGRCVAIDPWQAKASIVGQDKENAAWWGNQQMHDEVYGKFIANVAKLGLDEWMKVYKQTAAEVLAPKSIGLLIVDGNHGPDSIADVNHFAPNVTIGGVAYLDDINWPSGDVAEAVKRLISFGFTELYNRDTGEFFQRTQILTPKDPSAKKRKYTRKIRIK